MKSKLPPGWSRTISDLLAEKRDVSGEEFAWARIYEREQLRSWARFPKAGEVYELLGDARISYVTHWGAPFTGGGEGLLRAGTRIRVVEGSGDPEPIIVYAVPLDSARIEVELVPESVRSSVDYAGFSLSISTSELNRLFRLAPSDDHRKLP